MASSARAVRLALSLSLASILSAAPLFADRANKDTEHGRLPDGRAYRTDGEGNQLVDYIAELELSVESLNRQVQGLQGELDDKQKQMEAMSRSGGKVPQLSEKTLVGEAAGSKTTMARAMTPAEAPVCPPPVRCPEVTCPENAPTDCTSATRKLRDALEEAKLDLDVARQGSSTENKELQQRVARLEKELDKTIAQYASATSKLDSTSAHAEEARAEIKTLREQDAEERDKLSDTIASLQKELDTKNKELTLAQAQRDESRDTVTNVKNDLNAARADLAATQEKLAQAEQAKGLALARNREEGRVPQSQNMVAGSSFNLPVRSWVPAASAQESQQQRMSSAKARALDSIKGSLLSEVNRAKGLLSERDSLFATYRASNKVKFKLNDPSSSRRHSLQALPHLVQNATSVSELMLLRSEINEVRQKMQDDIALINRMSKLH